MLKLQVNFRVKNFVALCNIPDNTGLDGGMSDLQKTYKYSQQLYPVAMLTRFDKACKNSFHLLDAPFHHNFTIACQDVNRTQTRSSKVTSTT
ncbi:hypothetical protein NIES2135_62630 (plasmid) [Leptolyngbya boryana NIES-2135]|uniref:Uncharacterized protein n=1 Tax=Leptolyngbya boryana NIES-2135 TaxID=1973484 RepID=A0A1Z4JRQ8_LEPBY|nr:hypothetical protein NIES2135_62630 [Leptolyngbya boryana NIES-2135]